MIKVNFDTITNQIVLRDLSKTNLETRKAVKDVIKVLKKHKLPYLKAKEVLDYSNQALLNELFNKDKF